MSVFLLCYFIVVFVRSFMRDELCALEPRFQMWFLCLVYIVSIYRCGYACEYSYTVWRLRNTFIDSVIFGISESWDSNKDNIDELS